MPGTCEPGLAKAEWGRKEESRDPNGQNGHPELHLDLQCPVLGK